MTVSAHFSGDRFTIQQEKSGTILWLTGWSFPNTVFDRLHSLLPEFHHIHCRLLQHGRYARGNAKADRTGCKR